MPIAGHARHFMLCHEYDVIVRVNLSVTLTMNLFID